jgi:tetratricopeptide (TPR) repeat protein
MNLKCTIFSFSITCLVLTARAQPVSTLLKNAEGALGEQRFAVAAEQFEKAARLQRDQGETLFRAAEAYYRARDYAKALDCYRACKAECEASEIGGLHYARMLKQSGRCEEAVEAFRRFGEGYRGAHRAVIVTVLQNEIKGCESAAQFAENQVFEVPISHFDPLPPAINTAENAFAPIPFSDQLLYYSAIEKGRAVLMRAVRKNGVWQAPEAAQGLPEAAASRFGSGTFAPNGAHFYYTRCDEVPSAARGGSNTACPCALYALRRTESGWSEPERLRSYINQADQTVLHPSVAQRGGTEYLFFASDRRGGFGGLDLYVCERPADSEAYDFSFPQNLGNQVNTGGDEVSPFFDALTGALWFGSQGHAGLGGFDVFKTERVEGRWARPTNAGLPVNSPADDFFFVLKKTGEGGYCVSNRASAGNRDDDVFEFSLANEEAVPTANEPFETAESQNAELQPPSNAPMTNDLPAPRYEVHLEVVPTFDADAARYADARAFGVLRAEPLPAQGLLRVLLGDFSDLQQANEVAAALRGGGGFPEAFVVKKTARE